MSRIIMGIIGVVLWLMWLFTCLLSPHDPPSIRRNHNEGDLEIRHFGNFLFNLRGWCICLYIPTHLCRIPFRGIFRSIPVMIPLQGVGEE